MTVNREATCELDFQSMQPSLVYNVKAGMQMPWDDAYEIDAPIPDPKARRSIMKMVSLIALNVMSRRAALRALRNYLSENEIVLDPGVTPATLLTAFERHHKAIAPFLYQGLGVWMQCVDSEIAEQVLLRLARAGIPCLCVHDSFVVPASHQEFLKKVMEEEYKNRTGFTCRVRVESGRGK